MLKNRQRPDLADDIDAFIASQNEDCHVTKNHIEGAIWLLQKPE